MSNKEELQDMKLQIFSINNNNSRNSFKAQELENLIKLSNENGYVKENSLEISNYFLSDLNNANIVITRENLAGRGMDYRFIEGYGDKHSISRVFDIISKKFNLAFEVIEFKVWPETDLYKFYLKFNQVKNNWIGEDREFSLLSFSPDSQNEYTTGFSEGNYYYQNQVEFIVDRKVDDLIITNLPEYIDFKGFITRLDKNLFLFEIYNKSYIFKLNEKQMIGDIEYKLYYDNGLFLNENSKIYKIGE